MTTHRVHLGAPSRTRRAVAAVKARVEDTRRRVEARRPHSVVVDTGLGALQLQNESGGGLLAGAIAFRFFMFIVPFVFVVVMGLGLGADGAGADVHDLARKAGIAGVAATAVQSGSDAATATRWATFLIAVFALVVGARNFVRALWIAHSLIWRVPLQKLRHPTRAGFAFIGVVVATTLLLRGVYAVRAVTFVGWLLAFGIYTAALAALWLVCSKRVFPAPPGLTWRDVLPGALMIGGGACAMHLVTTLWIAPSTEAKSQAYGAIGAALTILLWAYIFGRLVTAAVAVNAAGWRRSHPVIPAG